MAENIDDCWGFLSKARFSSIQKRLECVSKAFVDVFVYRENQYEYMTDPEFMLNGHKTLNDLWGKIEAQLSPKFKDYLSGKKKVPSLVMTGVLKVAWVHAEDVMTQHIFNLIYIKLLIRLNHIKGDQIRDLEKIVKEHDDNKKILDDKEKDLLNLRNCNKELEIEIKDIKEKITKQDLKHQKELENYKEKLGKSTNKKMINELKAAIEAKENEIKEMASRASRCEVLEQELLKKTEVIDDLLNHVTGLTKELIENQDIILKNDLILLPKSTVNEMTTKIDTMRNDYSTLRENFTLLPKAYKEYFSTKLQKMKYVRDMFEVLRTCSKDGSGKFFTFPRTESASNIIRDIFFLDKDVDVNFVFDINVKDKSHSKEQKKVILYLVKRLCKRCGSKSSIFYRNYITDDKDKSTVLRKFYWTFINPFGDSPITFQDFISIDPREKRDIFKDEMKQFDEEIRTRISMYDNDIKRIRDMYIEENKKFPQPSNVISVYEKIRKIKDQIFQMAL